MSYLKRATAVIDDEIEELRQLRNRLDGHFESAIGTLKASVEQGGKILVFGIGKCSHIGEKIAATLTSTGSPAVSLNSLNALHGDLGLVKDGDVVLALSYSGDTSELLNVLPALRRFQVKIVSMTGHPDSLLGKHSDVVLDVHVKKEACPLNLAPTSSTTAMLVLGDALAMVLLEARDFKSEDFAKYHPAGTLGRSLLLTAGDIMRSLDDSVLVDAETMVSDVLKAMTQFKAGAAIIGRRDETLLGIYTHGDFVRSFQELGAEAATRTVGEFMTVDPIATGVDRLAVEVVRIFEDHRIDEIVVLDSQRHPVGLIDVQDLSRHKLV